jgi:hypothetical protein
MVVPGQQAATDGEFEKWYALLRRTTSDAEEIPPVGFRKAAVAFRNIRRNDNVR